jgi:hypothetical protein
VQGHPLEGFVNKKVALEWRSTITLNCYVAKNSPLGECRQVGSNADVADGGIRKVRARTKFAQQSVPAFP